MGEGKVFAPEARLELIEGEIVDMAPIEPPHAGRVNRLNRLLGQRAGDNAVVSVQDPLVISDRSVPQPDLALLKPRADFYTDSHPKASDVYLVVEVADTTLAFDLGTKVPLYARCGITEATGYGTSLAVKAGQSVACVALPEALLRGEELFP